jgi:hypothetical protein
VWLIQQAASFVHHNHLVIVTNESTRRCAWICGRSDSQTLDRRPRYHSRWKQMPSNSAERVCQQRHALKDDFGRLIPLTRVRSEVAMEWPRMEESATKKRRVRKGTHSCWECRRRKVRCIFASPEDLVCITCTRRHSRCVSQAVAEDPHWPTPGTTSKETIFRANERDDARSNPLVRAPAPLVDHVDDSSDFAIPTPSSQQISRVCLPGILLRAY